MNGLEKIAEAYYEQGLQDGLEKNAGQSLRTLVNILRKKRLDMNKIPRWDALLNKFRVKI